MPDISMCSDNKCPSRGDCHRYCAMPSEYRQAYADFERNPTEARCQGFVPRWSKDRTLDQINWPENKTTTLRQEFYSDGSAVAHATTTGSKCRGCMTSD